MSSAPIDAADATDRAIGRAIETLVTGCPAGFPVVCPAPTGRQLAERTGREIRHDGPAMEPAGSVGMVLLVTDEISTEGDRAEELIATAANALRPGGHLVVTAVAGDRQLPSRQALAATESPPARHDRREFTTADLEHLLMHRGLAVERLEQHGRRLLAVGRNPVSEQERTARFTASLSFKHVGAAALVRDDNGRLLCVFDSYRRRWTIPGGAVDEGEDPRSGAVRETFEESGVRVRAGDLLGVFSSAQPDRLLFVYGATPIEPASSATRSPCTRQPHEISDVVWLPIADALRRLNPVTRWRIEQCLDRPGETWCD